MLNFAVDECNVIRSLAEDLFLKMTAYWKKYGINVTTFDIDVTFSIPSSDLVNIMINSLCELASISQNQELVDDGIKDYECNSSQSTALNGTAKCFVPIGELLMTIYLHAFPIKSYKDLLDQDLLDLEKNETSQYKVVQVNIYLFLLT